MRIVLIVLSLCGIIVSALALQVHYSTGTEPCSINAHWDCGIVNHSLYSVIYGVPVALVGILGHAFLEILVLSRRKALFFLTTLGGVGYPGYLSHIEGQVLGVWCIYCVTSASILVLLMLLGGGWLLSGRSTAAKHRFSASMFGSAPTASDLKTSARNIFPPSSLS